MFNYLSDYDPFFDLFFPVRSEENNDMMKMDVIENDNSYIIKANIPGVKKEDVKIKLNDGRLLINVKYSQEIEEKSKYIYRERKTGEVSRMINVDKNLTNKDIDASIEDGVLTLTINKVKLIKDKQSQDIEIH